MDDRLDEKPQMTKEERMALFAEAERVIVGLRRAIEAAEYRLLTGRWPEKNSLTLQ